MEQVNLRNVEKIFILRSGNINALNGVNFLINSGEIIGIIGPNGAGKTTLMRIMLGLLKQTKGEVSVLGQNPWKSEKIKKRIGYLPERVYLPEFFTGVDFLWFIGGIFKINKEERRKRIKRLLKKTRLEERGNSKISTYSKGMYQRLLLAQAILNDGEILFLDEPNTGVDPLGTIEIRDIILDLKKEGKTIILNSHQLTEVERICDRVLFIDKGEIKREILPHMYEEKDCYEVKIKEPRKGKIIELEHDIERKINITKDYLEIFANKEEINEIIKKIINKKIKIISFFPKKITLEDIFLKYLKEKENDIKRNS